MLIIEKRAKDQKIDRLKRSNQELLKDIEELTDENTKLLGKVKILVHEEGNLRDQLQVHTQAENDLKSQLMKSFEGKVNNRTTPEKENQLDSALKNIDNSSINICPTCESLRDEIKDITRRLRTSQKETEMMKITNDELLKQIRLMAISEETQKHKPESPKTKDILKEPTFRPSYQQLGDLNLEKPTYRVNEQEKSNQQYSETNDRREELSFRPGQQTSKQTSNDAPVSSFNGLRPDLAETLRSLKESKNKLENFQFKMQKQKEDWDTFNTPFSSASKSFQIKTNDFDHSIPDNKNGYSQYLPNSENTNFLKNLAVKQPESLLPKRKDFSLPRTSDINDKLTSLLGGNQMDKAGQSAREEPNKSVFGYFKANHSDGLMKDDPFSAIKGQERCKESNHTRLKDAIVFKDLEAIEKLSKDDHFKLRPRREERLLSTLDDRIKADRTVDFGIKDYSRYMVSTEEPPSGPYSKKNRKSLGHAPQSRYLEQLSKLYDGEEVQASTSMTQDQSFMSNRRQSASQDRTALTSNDYFLRHINDRINSLVTK